MARARISDLEGALHHAENLLRAAVFRGVAHDLDAPPAGARTSQGFTGRSNGSSAGAAGAAAGDAERDDGPKDEDGDGSGSHDDDDDDDDRDRTRTGQPGDDIQDVGGASGARAAQNVQQVMTAATRTALEALFDEQSSSDDDDDDDDDDHYHEDDDGHDEYADGVFGVEDATELGLDEEAYLNQGFITLREIFTPGDIDEMRTMVLSPFADREWGELSFLTWTMTTLLAVACSIMLALAAA